MKVISYAVLLVALFVILFQSTESKSLIEVDKYFTRVMSPLEKDWARVQQLKKEIKVLRHEIASIRVLIGHVHKKVHASRSKTKNQVISLLEGLISRLLAQIKALQAQMAKLSKATKAYKRFKFLRRSVRRARRELIRRNRCKSIYGRKRQRCFAGDAQILMADGSFKRADQIKIGDMAKTGRIEGVMQFDASNAELYMYKGVMVTGDHSVLEKGVWKKVRDAVLAQPQPNAKLNVVYDFDTDSHRIIAGKEHQMFTDYSEVDPNAEIEKMELNLLNGRQ